MLPFFAGIGITTPAFIVDRSDGSVLAVSVEMWRFKDGETLEDYLLPGEWPRFLDWIQTNDFGPFLCLSKAIRDCWPDGAVVRVAMVKHDFGRYCVIIGDSIVVDRSA